MAGTGTAHLRPTASNPLLRVEDLVVEYRDRRGPVTQAVSGISLDALARETVGIVGESGCGKSSVGRAIMQLPRPTQGSVRFDGVELTELDGEALRRVRPRLQIIFQDPTSSLNPRRSVRELVGEGLRIWRSRQGDRQIAEHVDRALDAVGLDPATVGARRPHELSGGQCQRVCIARALTLDPRLVVCDEPVSALDVSVQAQILNLLDDMKARYGLTLLFIAHDLAVVKNVSDRVVVMYLGKLCEVTDPDEIFQAPAHPYTQLLLASIPQPDPNRPTFTTTGPGPGSAPTSAVIGGPGCRFRPRCPRAGEVCATTEPLLREVGPDHYVACHFPDVPVAAPARTPSPPT